MNYSNTALDADAMDQPMVLYKYIKMMLIIIHIIQVHTQPMRMFKIQKELLYNLVNLII